MLSLLTTLLCPLAVVGTGKMEVLYSWTEADFIFPPDKPRESYISSGEYIPKNNFILDVDVWKDRVFVSMPKFRPGSPVAVATVSEKKSNGNHLLQPYPDWSWYQGDCDGLTSVHRTQVDSCDRLWVIDSGLFNIMANVKRKCPPQLLIFDLKTDKLIRRHRFPDSVTAGTNTLMLSVKVDIRSGDCNAVTAYITDVQAFQLFVYDFNKDKSWRITNHLFYPYPLDTHYSINGVEFNLMDGIFAQALGPITKNGDRLLYFHCLTSVRESWVSTSVIRNNSLFEADPGACWDSFHVSPGVRQSQSTPEDMTDDGVLLYSLLSDNAIGCWNTRLPFTEENLDIAAKDDITMQFQSGMKVYGDKVWTLSSRYQNYHVSKEPPKGEIVYRVNVGTVSKLLKDTKCDPKKANE